MITRLIVRSSLVSGLFPLKLTEDFDKPVQTNTAVKLEKEQQKEIETESGLERLRKMFSIDEYDNISPGVNSAIQASLLSTFVGLCYGGFIQSRLAYLEFMERNQATAFKDHLDAKKQLQNSVTVNFAKGGFRWGWRLGLFCGSYVLITNMMATYRGRSSILDYVVAGSTTGAAYKMNLGLRGMVAGGAVGAVLGAVAGSASLGILALGGMTMEDFRDWQYELKENRDARVAAVFKAHDQTTYSELLLEHNRVVGPEGENLDAIPTVSTSQ